jgi:hypothetical protein
VIWAVPNSNPPITLEFIWTKLKCGVEFRAMKRAKCLAGICFLMLVTVVSSRVSTGQDSAIGRTDCAGLHAGITAEMARLGGTSELSVWVTFLLLNDSEATLNVSAESWKIVIDGEELRDSDYLFGNGVMPEGGYRNLRPGATYSLGKALSLSKYFPEQREYRISWKGKNFQSPTITFIAPAERIEK